MRDPFLFLAQKPKALATKHLPDFIMGRRMTIMDCVERGLKKGRGGEQQAAAQLIGLVCLQLGSVSDSEAIYKDQKASLLSVIADRSVLSSTRAQVRPSSSWKTH